jgi:hypothetical protein
MWMDAYVQETMIRDQIAEAQRQATRRHLLRLAQPPGPPARVRVVLRRLAQAVALPRLKQLIERMASS